MRGRGDSVWPKAKNDGCYGYTGEEMARKEKSDKQENGLSVLREDQWSWQPGC